MKNYTITVNGTAYDVTVEETAGGAAPAPAAKAAPAAPAAAPAPAPAPAKAAGGAAGIKKQGVKDMALVYSEVPCVAAGTFTTNIVKACLLYTSDAADE